MSEILSVLRERFPNEIQHAAEFRGDLSVSVPAKAIPPLLRFLKNTQTFEFLLDICGVDYLNYHPTERDASKRFDVVYHLFSFHRNKRIRLKVAVHESQSIPSVQDIYASANWNEREVYDMFGIRFDHHPNLRRILCHEEFVGHALRKDYAAEQRQPLSKAATAEKLMDLKEEDLQTEGFEKRTVLNIGPSHPAAHGTLRTMALLEGEKIVKAEVEIGYLHRCFEKMCETHLYHQAIPYTERLNYSSGPMNNFGFCLAMEKLMNLQIPKRGQQMRVIIAELARIADHFVCIGTGAIDLGAMTNFWYSFSEREKIYSLFEKWGGGRLFPRGIIIGGCLSDFPNGWIEEAHQTVKSIRSAVKDIDRLLTNNKIFLNRCVGVGGLSKEEALNFGYTGPLLRACGVELDLRKCAPYSSYEDYEFEIPISTQGDVYDRYLVRMEEIRQSCRIIEQALDHLEEGPVCIDDKAIVLPQKEDVYGNIEGLMNQFMLVIHGIEPPTGEIYGYIESANGEIGFYIVSDGTGLPYRVHCRAPSFAHYQAYPKLIQNQLIADAIATVGSLNIIAGEMDR
ncbi:MAG: NADH-quinone oxidoreductase subunit D [Deltaproteobacteria bacterium]|nr:NADH-quinone oxidoreductase subunit D [Deltaproteobacteria bacterium]